MKARLTRRNELLLLLTFQTLLAGAISLALAAGTTDESPDEIVWENELLRDWANGWDVDINNNPVDTNTACFGMPCTRPKLVKHKKIEDCPRDREHICGSFAGKTTYAVNPEDFEAYYDPDVDGDNAWDINDESRGLICD
ncbi:hypothetical protein BGZ49_009402 [Haplosporangium sp. Z 27]|nr:hypothetical protein BGZ49_009402 [Haplosporangium sp. Z 27]